MTGFIDKLPKDNYTGALETINYEHHEIHAGNHYNYCDYQTGLGSSDTIEFIMVTPNTTDEIHLTFDIYTSTGATVEFFTGASGISGGSSITPRNNNTNSSNTSGVTLTKDPATITSDGTRAQGYLAGAGRNAGFASREKELVLTPNTTYLVRITSTASSNSISWCADWYEHTPKGEQ